MHILVVIDNVGNDSARNAHLQQAFDLAFDDGWVPSALEGLSSSLCLAQFLRRFERDRIQLDTVVCDIGREFANGFLSSVDSDDGWGPSP